MTTSPSAAVPIVIDEAPREKPMTIGAVCKALGQEFPDISISKIRYLEDQKLLTPQRTPGGYRLYTKSDVARLRAILRLQRDEFLPLRVIRQELAGGGAQAADEGSAAVGSDGARARRRPAVTAPSSAAASAISGVMSRKTIPSRGKPGTSTTCARRLTRRASAGPARAAGASGAW